MLDREDDRVLLTPHIEIGVTPGVKVSAASKREAGLTPGATIFACMVHDDNGEVELTLQGAEISK